jgi:hypothetical protein
MDTPFFKKIEKSEVVIVDVTLIGETHSGKKLINSNVAYELGYAHGFHGDKVLLFIMNTYFGSPDNLPFDLKHRRWPVRFELSPDANKETRIEVKTKLVKELSAILKLYVENRKPAKPYEPIHATANAACYWQEGEDLVQRSPSEDNEKSVTLGYSNTQPLVYLKLWPDKKLPNLSGKELNDYEISQIEPLLGRTAGYRNRRNKYGCITYGGENAGELIASTQVFKNREIWGIDAFILRRRDNSDIDFIPTMTYEQGIIRSLNAYLKVAFERFGYTNIVHVETGLVNVKGFHLAMPSNFFDRYWGPLFEDINVQFTINKNDTDSIQKGLLRVFESVFDAAGTERPINLYDYPDKGNR